MAKNPFFCDAMWPANHLTRSAAVSSQLSKAQSRSDRMVSSIAVVFPFWQMEIKIVDDLYRNGGSCDHTNLVSHSVCFSCKILRPAVGSKYIHFTQSGNRNCLQIPG